MIRKKIGKFNSRNKSNKIKSGNKMKTICCISTTGTQNLFPNAYTGIGTPLIIASIVLLAVLVLIKVNSIQKNIVSGGK